jgi:hypothetical protein
VRVEDELAARDWTRNHLQTDAGGHARRDCTATTETDGHGHGHGDGDG